MKLTVKVTGTVNIIKVTGDATPQAGDTIILEPYEAEVMGVGVTLMPSIGSASKIFNKTDGAVTVTSNEPIILKVYNDPHPEAIYSEEMQGIYLTQAGSQTDEVYQMVHLEAEQSYAAKMIEGNAITIQPLIPKPTPHE